MGDNWPSSELTGITICQRDQSMLTFESASVQGTSGIVQKLKVCNPPWVGNAKCIALTTRSVQDLPFEKVKHAVQTLDAQPSSGEGGIIVMVTGALMVRLSPSRQMHKKEWA